MEPNQNIMLLKLDTNWINLGFWHLIVHIVAAGQKEVNELFYLWVGLQVVVKHIDRDGKISIVERVRPVPTLCSELASLSHHSMEITQSKQNNFELRLFWAHFQRVLKAQSWH